MKIDKNEALLEILGICEETMTNQQKAFYYGYMSGRTFGRKADYWLQKGIELALTTKEEDEGITRSN